jgi:uncharacterized membrane protein YdjX (TVP38/TMEM64 family)
VRAGAAASLLVAIAVLAAWAYGSPTFGAWTLGVVRWAEGVMRAHPVAGSLVFATLSAASAMLAFASSVVLVPPAVEVWGTAPTFVLLWSGWTGGALVAYAIGYFARPLLVRLVDKRKLRKYEALISRRMNVGLATLVCLAAPSEIPGYLFGGLRYPLGKFLAAIAIAEAVYAAGVVVAGGSVMEADPVPFALAIVALAAIAAGAGVLLRRHRKARRTRSRRSAVARGRGASEDPG